MWWRQKQFWDVADTHRLRLDVTFCDSNHKLVTSSRQGPHINSRVVIWTFGQCTSTRESWNVKLSKPTVSSNQPGHLLDLLVHCAHPLKLTWPVKARDLLSSALQETFSRSNFTVLHDDFSRSNFTVLQEGGFLRISRWRHRAGTFSPLHSAMLDNQHSALLTLLQHSKLHFATLIAPVGDIRTCTSWWSEFAPVGDQN